MKTIRPIDRPFGKVSEIYGNKAHKYYKKYNAAYVKSRWGE